MTSDAHSAAGLALDAGNVTTIGVAVIVGLVVVGFLIGLVITAIIGRILIVLLVVAAAVVVWSQRTSVENKIDDHRCDLTFFGVHLDPPESIKKEFCDSANAGNG